MTATIPMSKFELDETIKADMSPEVLRITRLIQKELYYDCYPQAPGWKALWRMSKGDKAEAITIMKGAVDRYIEKPEISDTDFEWAFDVATAQCEDGCEIEWLS